MWINNVATSAAHLIATVIAIEFTRRLNDWLGQSNEN